MKITKEELIPVKQTKSVNMYYDGKGVWISMYGYGVDKIYVPMSKVFQVKRGLESAVQRFYRKHEKAKKE